jgi:methionyl-tRNA formyltransferase
LNIVLFCATDRGLEFLLKIQQLCPSANLIVVSFSETPWEPDYLKNIQSATKELNGRFYLWDDIRNLPEKFWSELTIDIVFVVSWRYMISSAIYDKAKIGSYLFHDSLLPKYRGFSPTVWSIINGKNYTGVTLLEIDQKVDSGDIVDQIKVPIHINDNISDVLKRVTQTYLDLLEKNIRNIIKREIVTIPQDHSMASYTRKRLQSDNLIDWNLSAFEIYNFIRALSKPYPGAFTFINKTKLIIWKAKLVENPTEFIGKPGCIFKITPGEGVIINTGGGYIMLNEVQYENQEPECASLALNNLNICLG